MAYKYSFQTPDGQAIEFDSPTMLTRDEARSQAYNLAQQRALQQRQLEQTAEESRGFGGTIRDTVLGVGAGILGPIGEDLIGGGLTLLGAEELGEAARETFGEDAQRLREMQTPQLQARQQLAQQRLAEVEGEGFTTELGAAVSEYLSNPSLLFQLGAETLPQLIPIARAGRLAQGTVRRLTQEATEQTLQRAGLGGAASAAGALQGSSVGMETYDRVFEELTAQGMSEADASEQAIDAARKDAAQAGLITIGSTFAIPGAGAVERAVVGRATAGAAQGVPRRFTTLRGAGRGATGEALQEGIEEGSGAFISNISAIEAGADIDPLAGVGTQAGIGSLVGGLFGGPAGAVQARRDERARQAQEDLIAQQREDEAKAAEAAQRAEMEQPTPFSPVDTQQLPLPGFEPGALEEAAGPVAPETPPAAPITEAPAPTTAQRAFDFRSDEEQLAAIERELSEINETYADLSRSERRQVRQGLQQERDRILNRIRLAPRRPAQEAATTFEEAQPDLLGMYTPTAEPSTAVEAEAATRAAARERIEAARRRREGETFGGAQRELELGTPVEPVTLTEERLAEFGLPAQKNRPDRVRANFRKIAQRFEGLDITDPEQRAQVERELADIENRDARWVAPFSERMRQELQATEQQAEALQAERERIGLERAEAEAAPRRQLEEEVGFAVERGIERETEEGRRAALRQQLVDRQAERVREQARGRIPLTEEWKDVARTQLRQRQEEAQMRERGLDQMAEQEAADFELDMQYVDDRAPQLEPARKVAASDFVQQYTEAQAINDPELTEAIEQEARTQLGSQQWGRLKSGLSSRRRAQQRRLEQEAQGEIEPTQPDLLAQAEREPAPEPEPTPEPAAEPQQGDLFEAVETATEAAEDAQRAAEDAERAAEQEPRGRPSRRAVRGRQAPVADERAAEPSVDVDRERGPEPAGEPAAPEGRRVGRRRAPARRDAAREEPSDLALGGLPPVTVPLQRAFNAPTEENTNALLQSAANEGILSDSQLADFQQKIQAGDQARAKAIMHVYREALDNAYFTGDVDTALEMAKNVRPVRQMANDVDPAVRRAAESIAEMRRPTEAEPTIEEELEQVQLDEEGQVVEEPTEEGFDGDIFELFSRTPFVDKQLSTVDQLKNANRKLINKLKDQVEIEIVQSATDVPELEIPAGVRGVYYRGKVYIIADAVSEFDFETVIAHEVVGHAGMEGLLGRAGFNNLVNQINNIKGSNARMQEVLGQIRREYTNHHGEYQLDDKQEAREIIAHIAESKSSYLSDSGIRRVWDNIVRRVRAALAKLGFVDPSDVLLDQLIYEAALHVEGGRGALRKSRAFLRPEMMAAHTMQRAWDKGYRGFDVREAGIYLQDIAEGRREVPDRTQENIDELPIDDSFYDDVAFSRRAAAAQPVNDGFDTLASQRAPTPRDKPNPAKEVKKILRGDYSLFDTFRVRMVDAAATVEDKIMRLYNNSLKNEQGLINPMVSYVQSLRSEGLAAVVLRQGSLVFDKKVGLWKGVRQDGVASLTDVVADLAKLGERIGHDNAMNRFHAATIARRELEIDKNNAELQRKADRQRSQNKNREAEQTEAKIVDLYPNMDGAAIRERQRENRELEKLFATYPELQSAFDKFTQFKNGQIDSMVEAGVLSKEYAEDLKENAAYVPFNRLLDDADPNAVSGYEVHTSGLMRIGEIKRLRGSPREVDNVLDNMAKLSMWMTQATVRNHAAKELARGLREVEAESPGTAVKAEYKSEEQIPAEDRPHSVSWKENGKLRFMVPVDPRDAYAWRGTESATVPMLRPFAAFANFLRKGITLSPDFILSQLQQDTFRVFAFGGLKNGARGGSRVVSNWWRIRQDLRSGQFGDENLNQYGIVGQYDYMPEQARQTAEAEALGDEIGFGGKVIRFGERNAEASDLAQRKAVFDQTLADTNDETMAFWRASEIINFNRRGTSQLASVLRQIIPFMNAYMQGMNVLGKSMVGRGLSQEEKKQALGVFWGAMMKLSVLSGLYALMNADDDEYVNQPPHIRTRFFLVPLGDDLPPLKMAMPADLAFITKALPEAAVMQMMRDDIDSKKAAVELRDAFMTAVSGPNFTPQLVKPSLEAMVNYNFFTGAPIVGMGEQYKQIEDQYRESTSQLARLFSNVGISPLVADHLIKGYLGTLGGNALVLTDIVYENATGEERTKRELADLPISRVLFNRTQGTGFKQDFYTLRDEVRAAVGSLNLARRRGDVERVEEIAEDSQRLLRVREQINRIENTIEKSNRRIRQIQNSNLSAEEKRNRIDREREFQARLAPQIRRIRSFVYDE